jgi:hypothetical protein
MKQNSCTSSPCVFVKKNIKKKVEKKEIKGKKKRRKNVGA